MVTDPRLISLPDLPADIAFLQLRGIATERLAAAAAEAENIRVCASDVLLAWQVCSEEAYYRFLADELGLPFLSNFEIDGGLDLFQLGHCHTARLVSSALPDIVTAPRGTSLMRLIGAAPRLAATGRVAITTPSRLGAAMLRRFDGALSDSAANDLPRRDVELCARGRPTATQCVTLLLLEFVLVFSLAFAPDWTLIAVGALVSMTFLLQAAVHLSAVTAAPGPVRQEGLTLTDADLPTYTVLVPLYREATVLPHLLAALEDLDYPKAKLDIKLLVEHGDRETRTALDRLRSETLCEVVVCPPGAPRTKPRALNIGLRFARGDLTVVFDAEDRPEPDQLRRAAEAFARAPANLACMQAALAIDNLGESWIARFFALEYAQLFDVKRPGLAALGMPLPLGGTSNHFRTEVLRRVGAWDAWNVTEDADLGLRLARRGYAVGCLASTTWEEAPLTIAAWLPQRTRWLKGWMQTSLVHGLPSSERLREVGLLGTVAIFCHSYGLVLSCLTWPIFTVSYVLAASWERVVHAPTPWHAASGGLAASVFVLGLGSLGFSWTLGALRRRVRLAPADLLRAPLYFGLVSLAAWRALWQLLDAPSHWAKTAHGLSRQRALRRRRPGAATQNRRATSFAASSAGR
jgi:cellulose synthase/poly-beta-1,6-N-acetylglucosamine synthase-like glycosyltransferase